MGRRMGTSADSRALQATDIAGDLAQSRLEACCLQSVEGQGVFQIRYHSCRVARCSSEQDFSFLTTEQEPLPRGKRRAESLARIPGLPVSRISDYLFCLLSGTPGAWACSVLTFLTTHRGQGKGNLKILMSIQQKKVLNHPILPVVSQPYLLIIHAELL